LYYSAIVLRNYYIAELLYFGIILLRNYYIAELLKGDTDASILVSTGFISHIGAVAENLLFWLDYFLSGCSEKSFSACRKKVFLSERVEPATFGIKFRAKTGALAIMTLASLNKS
jgi:hypothetical protein